MHFKVEKTGCSIRKGMVQIRYGLYLDAGDYRYDKHYVEVPIIPAEGYQGLVEESGIPTDQADYDTWVKSLPTKMQNNPFCNHFVQVDPTITDVEILYVGELAFQMAKEKWDKDESPIVKNQPIVRSSITQERIDLCEAKLEDIQSKTLEKVMVV